jgi:hypothetical protein
MSPREQMMQAEMARLAKVMHKARMERRRQVQLARNERGTHFEPVYCKVNRASWRIGKLQMIPKEPYIKFKIPGINKPFLMHPTKGRRRVTEYERQER